MIRRSACSPCELSTALSAIEGSTGSARPPDDAAAGCAAEAAGGTWLLSGVLTSTNPSIATLSVPASSTTVMSATVISPVESSRCDMMLVTLPGSGP